MTARVREHRREHRDLLGYGLVAASFFIWGSLGALVRGCTMPESALVFFRMAIAAALLGALFGRGSVLEEVRRPQVARGLLMMGCFSAGTLVLFFVALRLTDVAVGMFLIFVGPIYVALLAPRFTGQRLDRVVYPALAVALSGMGIILMPGLLGVRGLSAIGVACGVGAGFCYAGWVLSAKWLTRRVRSSTIGLVEAVLVTLIVSPLAAWQIIGGGYQFTRADVVVAIVLGVLVTAVPQLLYPEGMRRVRVEHASILGYLEPVSAPLYALVLLGEKPALATIAGGILIVVAGVLVVVFGEAEKSPEPDGGVAHAGDQSKRSAPTYVECGIE